jgi:RNA polymerase sigma factor (sigma-70 family)
MSPERLDRLIKGDEREFSILVDEYAPMVYRLVYGYFSLREEAEDVTQEVFLSVFQSLSSFKGKARFSTWLYRLTIHKCQEHWRYKKRKKRTVQLLSIFSQKDKMDESIPSLEKDPSAVLQNKELHQQIDHTLKQLPFKQLTAFTLHAIQGLSYEEVAQIMGKSVSSVESLIFRARRMLREKLQEVRNE